MRTSEFTYKKTKKVVEKFRGLTLDLSVQDAANLMGLVGSISSDAKIRWGFFNELYKTLDNFVKEEREAEYYVTRELQVRDK